MNKYLCSGKQCPGCPECAPSPPERLEGKGESVVCGNLNCSCWLAPGVHDSQAPVQEKGVACLNGHDLTHYVQCGQCFDDLKAQLEKFREAIKDGTESMRAANQKLAVVEKKRDEQSDLLNRYEDEIKQLQSDASSFRKISVHKPAYEKLQVENAKLKEALEFYASRAEGNNMAADVLDTLSKPTAAEEGGRSDGTP